MSSPAVTDILEVSHDRSKMRQENEGINAEVDALRTRTSNKGLKADVDALTLENGEMEKRLRLNAEQFAHLQAEVDALRTANKGLKADVDALTVENGEMEKRLRLNAEHFAHLQAEVDALRTANKGLKADVDALTVANGEMEKRLRLNATNNMKFPCEEDWINLIRQTETPNSFTKEDGEKLDEPLDSQKQQVRHSMYELDALKKMCDQLGKQLAQLEVTRGESTVETVQIEEFVGEMERKIGMVQTGIQATWKETRHAQRQVRTELRVCASRSAELERERDILVGELEREQRNKEREWRDKEEAINQHWALKRERDHSSCVIETSRSNSQILEFTDVKHEQGRKENEHTEYSKGELLDTDLKAGFERDGLLVTQPVVEPEERLPVSAAALRQEAKEWKEMHDEMSPVEKAESGFQELHDQLAKDIFDILPGLATLEKSISRDLGAYASDMGPRDFLPTFPPTALGFQIDPELHMGKAAAANLAMHLSNASESLDFIKMLLGPVSTDCPTASALETEIATVAAAVPPAHPPGESAAAPADMRRNEAEPFEEHQDQEVSTSPPRVLSPLSRLLDDERNGLGDDAVSCMSDSEYMTLSPYVAPMPSPYVAPMSSPTSLHHLPSPSPNHVTSSQGPSISPSSEESNMCSSLCESFALHTRPPPASAAGWEGPGHVQTTLEEHEDGSRETTLERLHRALLLHVEDTESLTTEMSAPPAPLIRPSASLDVVSSRRTPPPPIPPLTHPPGTIANGVASHADRADISDSPRPTRPLKEILSPVRKPIGIDLAQLASPRTSIGDASSSACKSMPPKPSTPLESSPPTGTVTPGQSKQKAYKKVAFKSMRPSVPSADFRGVQTEESVECLIDRRDGEASSSGLDSLFVWRQRHRALNEQEHIEHETDSVEEDQVRENTKINAGSLFSFC